MKKSFCLLGALLLSLCIFSGCKSTGGVKSKLCQCWVFDDDLFFGLYPTGLRFGGNNKLYTLIQGGDGAWYELSDEAFTRSYAVSGSNITITAADGAATTVAFSVSGEKLTIKYEGGEESALTRQSVSPSPKSFAEIPF